MLNSFQHPGWTRHGHGRPGPDAGRGTLISVFVKRNRHDIFAAMDRVSFVYILASRFRGTVYTGVTSDLTRRIWEHRNGIRSRFPSRYAVYRLVWFEPFGDIGLAILREKQLKRWHRPWKINFIEQTNPHWDDLAVPLGFAPLPETPKLHRPTRHAQLVSASSLETPGAGGGLDPETSSG